MSYAEVAKKGPKQAPEDVKVPNPVPEIEHSDSGVHSLDSNSTSISTPNPPSYAEQQKMAEDAQREAEQLEREGKQAAEQAERDARDFMKRAEESATRLEAQAADKYQEFTKQAKNDWDKLSKNAQQKYHEFSREANKQAEQAKKEGKKAEEWADKNKGNPVVIGNVVAITALGALLGAGAYRLHRAGQLTWNIVGLWAGAVGLFAVGDYYVSQYFFKKYPPKQ